MIRSIIFIQSVGLLVTSILSIGEGTKITSRQLEDRLSYDEIMEKNNIKVSVHDRDNTGQVLPLLPNCDLQCLNGGSCSYVSNDIQILQEEFQKGSMIQYCTCPINYTGMSCEIQKQVASENNPDDCLVEQSISDFAYSMCLRPYTEYCTSQLDTKVTQLNYCTNGGKCVNWIESAKSVPYNPQLVITDSSSSNGCLCPPEFYGAHCELVRLGYRKQSDSTALIQDKKTYYNWTKRNDSTLTTGNDKIDELLQIGRYYVDSVIGSPSSELNNNNANADASNNTNASDNTNANDNANTTTTTNLGNYNEQITSHVTRFNLATGVLFGIVVGILIAVLGLLYILLRWRKQKINTQNGMKTSNSNRCCMNPFRLRFRVMTHIPTKKGMKQSLQQQQQDDSRTGSSSAYETINQLKSYDIFENNTIDRSHHETYGINNNNQNNDIEARSIHCTISSSAASSNHTSEEFLSSSSFRNNNNNNYNNTSSLVLDEEQSVGSSTGGGSRRRGGSSTGCGSRRRGGSSSCSGSERTRSVLDQLESFYTDESLLPSSSSKECYTTEIEDDIVSVVKSKSNVVQNNRLLALPQVTTVHSNDDSSIQFDDEIDQRSDRSRDRSSTQHWKNLSKSFLFNDNEVVN